MDQFTYQGAEEAFHWSIVVTIAALAHTTLYVEISQ
jgi:hypothetical protein